MKRLLLILCLVVFHSAYCANEAAANWCGSALRPGDTLEIKVFRASEFDRSVLIEDDGTFAFPLCGVIKAVGRTPRQIGAELQQLLASQLASPHVDVVVTTWAPRTIYLLGEFKNGSISMQLPIYSPMTAMQAISVAGGFTDFVDLAHIVVQRRAKDGKSIERHPIDVSELYGGTNSQKPFIMMPDDTLLAPKAAPVNVSGAVQTPGAYSIDTKRPPTCSELLIRAGGCILGADVSNILVIRLDDNGKRQAIPVSVKSVSLGSYEKDIVIKPGDNIFVGTAQNIYVMGQVKDPKGLMLPPDSAITVNQAIALAGGLTPTASRSGITVIRGDKRMVVDLSKLYGKGEVSQDIPLQYGDIVFVPESFW